jgi:hypothetical protein
VSPKRSTIRHASPFFLWQCKNDGTDASILVLIVAAVNGGFIVDFLAHSWLMKEACR